METTLQVPLSKNLKQAATVVARDYGFSSLQEVVRILLNKLSRRELRVDIVEQFPTVRLSKKNEARYLKMDKDFETGTNVYRANSVEDLMRQLHS